MKTYSIATLNKNGIWITNIQKYFNLDEIDFDKVEKFCLEREYIAYGYYYGNNSNELTSDKCRTTIKVINKPSYSLTDAMQILRNDGKIFYSGQMGLKYEKGIVWMKVRYEDIGVTELFGIGTDDKIVDKRYYINGWSEIELFLKNNLGLK